MQGQQNHGLIDGRLRLCREQPGRRGDLRATVTMLPHKSSRLIQAVGFVPLQVINQNFIR